MDAQEEKEFTQKSCDTLRRPVRIIKKRSGPLHDALNSLHSENGGDKPSIPVFPMATSTFTAWQVTPVYAAAKLPTFSLTASSPQPARRRLTIKEKEKKRERWLLTRKTWKYMTDAGRKLIPDGAHNRKEDISKIETHFQHICVNEPRFVLWRRKSSYPGAVRNSKRRLKHLLQHIGQKGPQVMDALEQEEANNADQVIDLLQSYLKMDEAFKTTTLLSSKTIRPDQTISPSARRPGRSGKHSSNSLNMSSRGPGFLTPQPPKGLHQLNVIDQLLERLRILSQSASINVNTIPTGNITPAILEDKALLKQVYNSLRKQQLHRILSKHSSPPLKSPRSKLTHSSSLSSLLNFSSDADSSIRLGYSKNDNVLQTIDPNKSQVSSKFEPNKPTIPIITGTVPKKPLQKKVKDTSCGTIPPTHLSRQRKAPSTLDIAGLSSASKPHAPLRGLKPKLNEKHYNSCGTQTNFVPLPEIKRLAEEYKEQKRDETALNASSIVTPGAIDDEAEKCTTAGTEHHDRKSSIDNEDVSQSVSDTIKRYLRMARKKGVHDDNANRFKRVNYDRNLRNIKAKGEINPPGIDDDNSKAVQTLEAWPVIYLDYIRGNESSGVLEDAHLEWQISLYERMQRKLEYEQKISGQTVVGDLADDNSIPKPPTLTITSSSAPNSPMSSKSFVTLQATNSFSSLRLASSQFLSNLWHGASRRSSSSTIHDDSASSRISSRHGPHNHHHKSLLKLHRFGKSDQNIRHSDSGSKNSTMKKSKSSSNVGQFVTRKILKSRSKSQTRSNAQTSFSKWAPVDKFTWTSSSGDCILIKDSCLHNLTDIEAKVLQRVAIEKISELNIGVNLSLDHDGKAQKRRVLLKKKAITTSFFDMGRKDAQSGGIFGKSLECCLTNDKKRESTLKALSERGSKNSIVLHFRSDVGNESSNKLHESVRSYESLPSSSLSLASPHVGDNTGDIIRSSSGKLSSGFFGNISKSTSQISRSQSDIRRQSQDFDLPDFKLEDSVYFKELQEISNTSLQVPSFITACIKHLEDHGLNMVGLFRVSTSKKRVKQMREVFDKSSLTNIDPETCPNDVATLLKEFLRDLPEPLLSSSLYKAFIETQRIRNRRLQLEAISHLVKLLPVAHRDTLYVLLKFLAKVASCSDDIISQDGEVKGNKMDSHNLATVFAPNILRTVLNRSANAADAAAYNNSEQESMSDAINVIRIMIDHYEELFRVPAELLDIVYSHMLDACPEELYVLCEQRSQSVRDNIGYSCPSLCSPEQIILATSTAGPLSKSASNIASTSGAGKIHKSSKASPKRMYTRESVMHDNDASHVPEVATNGSNEVRRHSNLHTSRNSLTRRGNAHDSEAVDLRQSLPDILDKSAVVSGSLKIPVPVAHAGHLKLASGNFQEKNDLDEVTPGTLNTSMDTNTDTNDYSDLPYIEYTTAGLEQEMCSLSFVTKVDGSANDYRQLQQQLGNERTFSFRKGSTTPSSSTRSVPISSFETQALPSIGVRYDPNALTKLGSNEPKLPTSISNIGGAILRSKTAEFERMSVKDPQASLNMIAPAATTTISTTTTATTPHLYKRQELIPSAKRGRARE